MRIGVYLLILTFLILVSCSQQRICAAYQSSFIYGKEALKKKFSYFEADTTPKVFMAASKSKYLVAVPESYRKKYQRLQVVEMKPVYPSEPDSLKALALLYSENDSIMEVKADSIHTASGRDESGLIQKSPEFRITKTKEKYNNDQEYYLWFFRKTLILPDIRYHLEKKAHPVEEKEVETIQENVKPEKPQQQSIQSKKKSPFKLPSLRSKSVADSVSNKN